MVGHPFGRRSACFIAPITVYVGMNVIMSAIGGVLQRFMQSGPVSVARHDAFILVRVTASRLYLTNTTVSSFVLSIVNYFSGH